MNGSVDLGAGGDTLTLANFTNRVSIANVETVQGGTGNDGLVLMGTGAEAISKFLSFQTLSMQGTSWNLTGAARLQGDRLSLSLDRSSWMPDSAPLRFTLQVAGGRLEGEAVDGDQRYRLRATRLNE